MTPSVIEVIFRPTSKEAPHRASTPANFRQMLWELGGKDCLPPIFWNRDENGETLPSPAEVRYLFQGSGVGMVALTEQATELLAENIRVIHRIALRIFEAETLSVSIIDHTMSADIEQRPNGSYAVRKYHLPRLILGTHKFRASISYGDNEPRKWKLVEQVVRASLDTQAHMLGMTLPPYFLKFDQSEPLRFVPVRIANKNTISLPVCNQVRFTSNLLLSGVWSVGAMTTKGYGRILVERPAYGAHGAADSAERMAA